MAAASSVEAEFGRTIGPKRPDMGGIALWTREGGVEICKRIEAGQQAMVQARAVVLLEELKAVQRCALAAGQAAQTAKKDRVEANLRLGGQVEAQPCASAAPGVAA